MNEMIDRVARALHTDGRSYRTDFDSISPAAQTTWRDMARTAITAMREPTHAMIDAGWCHIEAVDMWEAMIDAALKDDPAFS